MKNKIFKAFKWEFTGTLLGYVAEFITTLILARLLTPKEFGIVAIAMVFIYLFNLITDFGFSQALIQRKENSELTLSSVFFFNIFISVLLFIICFFLAPLITYFYEQPILTEIIRILTLVIILKAFSTIQTVILTRNLDFKSLTIQLIISKSISSIIGIYLALHNFGVYALVYQIIIGTLISTIFLWKLSTWRPIIAFSLKAIQPLISYSIYIFLGQITHNIILKIDELIIGKLFSINTLGFYSRANSMADIIKLLFSNSVNKVFFPILCKLQSDKIAFDKMYITVYSIICFMSFFLSGILILIGEYLIIGLFGEQWYPSIEIFNILMFQLFSFPVSSFLVAALLAKGFSEINFYAGLARKGLKLSTLLLAFFVSFEAFLWGLVCIAYITTFYNNLINSIYLRISLKKQLLIFYKFFLFAIISYLITSLNPFYNYDTKIVSNLISIIIFSLIYLFFTYKFDKKIIPLILKTIIHR